MKDFYYFYLFGNDTVTTIANNEIFKLLISTFDNKAKVAMG